MRGQQLQQEGGSWHFCRRRNTHSFSFLYGFLALPNDPRNRLDVLLDEDSLGLSGYGEYFYSLLLYGCFFIGVLPSTHPALAKRPKAVLIGTFFLMAFALGIIALGQDIHSSVLMGSAFILFALAYGLQTPLDFVFPNMLFPAGSRARLVGLTTTISRIGSMGAAFAFPLLSESFSVESLFWAGCAFLLFGAAFSWKNAPQDAY